MHRDNDNGEKKWDSIGEYELKKEILANIAGVKFSTPIANMNPTLPTINITTIIQYICVKSSIFNTKKAIIAGKIKRNILTKLCIVY